MGPSPDELGSRVKALQKFGGSLVIEIQSLLLGGTCRNGYASQFRFRKSGTVIAVIAVLQEWICLAI